MLLAIAEGSMSRKAAAKEAGVSVRTVNRWMKGQGVKRPPSKRARARDLRLLQEKSRKSIIQTTKDEEAKVPAFLLGVSLRTVDRLRKKYGVKKGNDDG